ncbi:uncharacterized protein LOC127083834 [Lathyrus oleraceus]|uniref:Uncharacterized protein n=2 Tax=Pisum sativum TaxID=3888 RepID=A0A9D5AC14_PEA|nr:uncharacterized protein LOC127083834 [Pisum sativum]KAI5402789.1 hypothetical protein KIW84_050406 [Pisum sativum]
MEPVFDQFKAFAKSGHDFFDGVFRRRNPFEILKRLQREAFSDLMKLRDRQEKVERMLSFYKSSKGGPFQEASTHVRGQMDFTGALLIMGDFNQQNLDIINRAGIKTGIDSRFVFETTIGKDNALAAEFVAIRKGKEHHNDVFEMPLSLAKLSYTTNVNDWLSLTAVPVGAQCRDVAVGSSSFDQSGKGLTDLSSFGPPLLNLRNGSAIGIAARKSCFIASLAQFVSGLGIPFDSNTMDNSYSTFVQLACQFPRGTKLSVLGNHQLPFVSKQLRKVGAFTIPLVLSNQHEASETEPEASPYIGTRAQVSGGSTAIMLESELDGFTKLGGWVEMNALNPKSVQWAVTLSDVYEDSFGWGMSLGGIGADHFQAESYLKFNMGDKFCLKPGLAFATDGNSRIGALMLRSNWSL